MNSNAEIEELKRRLKEAQQHSKEHDAEVAAKALERFADYIASELPEAHPVRIEDDCRKMAAEYRAKAGRKE